MSKRKLYSGGSLKSDQNAGIERGKKYKWNTSGVIEEVTSSSPAEDDEIVITGTKSNLRRMADMERNISILATSLYTEDSSNAKAATKSYVDNKIDTLVGGAPNALNTLNELAAAMADNSNFAGSMTNSLSGKVGITSAQALRSTNAVTVSNDTITIHKADGTSESVTIADANTWRGIHDTPVNGATDISISSNWAYDNVKTPVPSGALFTDTNKYLTGMTFNTGNGILTATRNGLSSVTVDLDGRYALDHSHPYDNYNGWDLFVDSSNKGRISSGENVNFVAGSNVSLGYSTTDNAITINSSYTDTNTNKLTTWKLQGDSGGAATINHNETVDIAGGTNVTTSRSGNTITINATDTNTNTNKLTTFQVEDGDGTEVTMSHGKEWKFLEGNDINVNWTDTSNGSDTDPFDLQFSHKNTTRSNTTSSATAADGGTVSVVDGVTTNSRGHVTGVNTKTVTLPSETLTSLSHDTVAKELTYIDEAGNATDISLEQYIDDTNLSRLTNGTLAGGTLTMNRDDSTSFTVNLSSLLDDTVANDGTVTVTGGTGLTGSGAFTMNQAHDEIVTIHHADTSSQSSVNNSGRTYIQDITLDSMGHITGISSATETVVDTNTNKLTTWKVTGDSGGSATIGHGETVDIAGGSNVTTSRSGNTITIHSTDTNTNTIDMGDGFKIANSGGTDQFTVTENEEIRFAGSGATSVSFDAATQKVTIHSTDTNTNTDTIDMGDGFKIANSGGTDQFTVTENEEIRFAGSGATSVSFDASTQKVTIHSTDTNTDTNTNKLTTWKVTGDSGGSATIGHGETVDIAGGSNVTTSRSGNTITINATDTNTDTNTTYDLTIPTGTTKLRLDGSDNTDDDIEIAGGTNVTVTRNSANKLTISSTDTNTNTDTIDMGDGFKIANSAGTDQFTVTENEEIRFAGSGATSVSFDAATQKVTISSTDTNTDTVYSHPVHPGDDINLDTGTLSGATVISDLDFNVTTDTKGHVTDANASYSTRNITAANVGALPITGGEMTGALTIDVDNATMGALRIEANQTDPDGGMQWAQMISSTLSGSDTVYGDRLQGGIHLDINSTQTGGGTTHEHRAYGVYVDLDSTGTSDIVTGGYFKATATPASGVASEVAGVVGYAEDDGGNGSVTNVFGVKGNAYSDNSTSDTNLLCGGLFKAFNAHDSGVISAARGVLAQVNITAGTGDIYGDTMVVDAQYDNDSNIMQTHTSYLYYGNYAGQMPTTPYGVYIADAVPNHFAGSIRTGDGSTSPASTAWASYGFKDETNTGMYRPFDNQIGFMVDGESKMSILDYKVTFQNVSAGVDIDGNVTATEFHGDFHGDGSNLTNLPAGGGGYNMQVFTSSGTYTKSSGVKAIKVTVTGGGGGGTNLYGGGAGGTAICHWSNANSITSNTVPVTIGAAGSGYSGGGSTSSFGSYCSATGGGGGGSYYGGNGGVASGGDLNIRGGGGSGGGWHTGSAEIHGGIGGASYWGGGGYGCTGSATKYGGSGSMAYGGGAGGNANTYSARSGKAGVVMIEEFF